MSALLRQMLLDSPSGLWPLNETSGTTAYDASGHGLNGTYTGGTRAGGALGPLGATNVGTAGGYVSVPDNALLSPEAGTTGAITVECFLVPTLSGSSGTLYYPVAKAQSPYEFALWHRGNGEVHFSIWDSAGNDVEVDAQRPNAAAGTLVTGLCFHLVGTYDRGAGVQALYVNGALVDTYSSFVGGRYASDTTSVLHFQGTRGDGIGADITTPQGWVAIYPTALSATRIKAHYQAGIRSGVMVG